MFDLHDPASHQHRSGDRESYRNIGRIAYTKKLDFGRELTTVQLISVVICFVTSSFCSIIFLVLLFICAFLKNAFRYLRDRESSKSLSPLSKEERRLVFNLGYYVRLAKLELTEHIITTKDGFRLVLHRIVDKSETSAQRSRRYPILFVHGLMQSSAAFVTSGDNSLAMYLFKCGYDIWLGNNRCGFNPDHSVYNRMDVHMWNWGIEEMGCLDLPSMIDFVLNKSSVTKLALVAHSQGTTQTFYALARDCHPEIGEKLSSFSALSPAVYTGPLLDRWFLKFIRILPQSLYHAFFGHHAFMGVMSVAQALIPGTVYTYLGYVMFNYLLGWDDLLWDSSYRSRQFLFSPVYVSSQLMAWWLGQEGFASHGCIFDELTDRWFNDMFPPLAMFLPGRDNLVDPYALVSRLSVYERFADFQVYDIPNYSHLDVLWASDVNVKVGRPLAAFINKHVQEKSRWDIRVA